VSWLTGAGPARPSPALPRTTLAVDLALAPDGRSLAVAIAGDAAIASLGSRVMLGPVAALTDDVQQRGCVTGPAPEVPPEAVSVDGDLVAIAFAADGTLVAQTREPATLQLPGRNQRIALATDSRADTGHAVFHSDSGNGIACASCHPEGEDDGRVWQFTGTGRRRTQYLRGGLSPTLPLHWGGDLADFDALVGEVFQRRMGGPPLTHDQRDALVHWLDAQPSPRVAAPDAASVARGRALFASAELGCATCHSGPAFTNNATVDVGTGLALQVPRLIGLAVRAPYMHDGCARTLADRFGAPCGGDGRHGATSRLSPAQVADLVAFLGSL
jgi:hypothetical protein